MLPIGKMNIKDTAQLSMAIRLKRRQLGLTQKELAMTCGTGARFIVDLEKGKSTCHIGKVLGVIQSLGLKLEINLSIDETDRDVES
jgi:HTH-type transcriptional regulator/antitoxin HipB